MKIEDINSFSIAIDAVFRSDILLHVLRFKIIRPKSPATVQNCHYSNSQNDVPFQPPDNLVKVGKNSQIKARKSEHGYSFKNRVRQHDFILQFEAL